VQRLVTSGSPAACTANLANAVRGALAQAPQIDIGSRVSAGTLLLEIATPERLQAIVEKQTLVEQRDAELAAARTALATFEAAINAAKAQKLQAQADVRKFESEHSFRTKELKRLKELVLSRTVPQEIADEKEHQVNAALAAWESSQARVQTAQAELAVVSSKFATAHADIRVKETLVQVARDELGLAHLLADYSRIYAPFDGVITYRGVDEGDFVQNATSGQTRKLMTVTTLDKVKVVLQAPDRDAPWVQVGAEAMFIMDARTLRQVAGRVTRIAHALDPQTRTMQVEIDLENRDRQLLAGMYGKVILTLQKIPNAHAIPATAVYSRRGENFILQVHKGIARRQRVRIRYDDGKEMEVVRLMGDREVPLDGSEELIVSNKGEIAEGQRVKATLLNKAKSAAGAPGKEANHDNKVSAVDPAQCRSLARLRPRPTVAFGMSSRSPSRACRLSAVASACLS
jgi:RND family efflux transporter MFP subunit